MQDLKPVTAGIIVFVLRGAVGTREVLFLRRSGGKYGEQWWPIGGTCKLGEKPLDTALREIAEETGLSPTALYGFGNDIAHVDGRSRIEAFVALVRTNDVVKLNYEHSAHRWLSAEEACGIALDTQHIVRLRDEFMDVEPTAAILYEFGAGI